MPAVHFSVRWPDGKEERCYSPSTVIHEYYKAGDSFSVAEFLARAEQALNSASNRVEARYGYFCSSAMDQLGAIKRRCASYEDQQRQVVILSMDAV